MELKASFMIITNLTPQPTVVAPYGGMKSCAGSLVN